MGKSIDEMRVIVDRSNEFHVYSFYVTTDREDRLAFDFSNNRNRIGMRAEMYFLRIWLSFQAPSLEIANYLCSCRNYLYFSLCSPNQLKTCSISCPSFVFSSTPTQQSTVYFFSSLDFSSRVACTRARIDKTNERNTFDVSKRERQTIAILAGKCG